ncbi:antibiotic biosynthesis monooxygenase [Gluconobacter cerinus]|nr:antibiotic biosynthesis monooxygenase [Gluconobacter cerinus]
MAAHRGEGHQFTDGNQILYFFCEENIVSHAACVVAILTVSSDQARELELELVRCIVASRSEEGCQRYVISRDQDHAGRFTAEERWASTEAFEQHLETPHFRSLAALLDRLDASVQLMKVTPLDEISDAI